jgi:hypothetical protein
MIFELGVLFYYIISQKNYKICILSICEFFYFDNWIFYYYFESEIRNYINISDFEKLHKTRKW